jgi:hypothetical protein
MFFYVAVSATSGPGTGTGVIAITARLIVVFMLNYNMLCHPGLPLSVAHCATAQGSGLLVFLCISIVPELATLVNSIVILV